MSRPSTDTVLPSLGLAYDGKVPGGVVKIRPMITQDEKIMAINDPTPESQARMIDNLFSACVSLPHGFTPDDLLGTDRLYLFIQLRIASYGEQYPVEMQCKHCRGKISKVLNLNTDLDIKQADPDNYLSSLVVSLDNGDLIHFHHSTGKDQKRMLGEVKRIQRAAPNMKGDPSLSIMLALAIDEVEGDNPIPADDKQKFLRMKAYVDEMPVSRAWAIRDAINDTSTGYTMKFEEETCPHCGTYYEMEFTPSAEFFRPYRKKSGVDSERTALSGQAW